MKLELELGKIIAGPYTNFGMECDFARCAELQMEIKSLSALIDGPSPVSTNASSFPRMTKAIHSVVPPQLLAEPPTTTGAVQREKLFILKRKNNGK